MKTKLADSPLAKQVSLFCVMIKMQIYSTRLPEMILEETKDIFSEYFLGSSGCVTRDRQ